MKREGGKMFKKETGRRIEQLQGRQRKRWSDG